MLLRAARFLSVRLSAAAMPSTLAALAVAATAVLPAVSAQFVTAPQNLTLKKGAAGVNVRYKEVRRCGLPASN